jgi:hypothetical protein
MCFLVGHWLTDDIWPQVMMQQFLTEKASCTIVPWEMMLGHCWSVFNKDTI